MLEGDVIRGLRKVSRDQLKHEVIRCIVEGDQEESIRLAHKVLAIGINPYEAITWCSEAMKLVGEKFERGEYFLPEVLMAARAMQAFVDVVKPHLKIDKTIKKATIVLGVVAGDIHNLGKNLVRLMLEAAGFNVIDLGEDVPKEKFIEAIRESNAEILGLSALMTTTMLEMKEVIKELIRNGLRDKVKVVIGGGPTTPEFAREIGADGWAPDAMEAVRVIEKLLER